MKTPTFLTFAFTVALGAAVLVGQQQRPIRPPGQSLLGVGTKPSSGGSGPEAFFDDNVLQEIRLTMNAKDWDTLKNNYLDNTYYPADFKWRDQTLRNIGIRSRGTGSRSGVKPGLRVDFDRYTTGQTFLTLKSFVLRNNTQDPTNIRERVSMLLFRRVGESASRETHTRMYVNDVYQGLFTIVESVDKGFLSKTFGEDSGFLYKYDYPVDGTPYFFEDRGSNGDTYVPLPFKPETHETDPQGNVIAELVQAVNLSADSAFRSQVAPYLDLKKFLRHVAVETFVLDADGFNGNFGINNFYFYRFNNQKLFVFIPWDKSEAFSGAPSTTIFYNINGVAPDRKNRLLTRALADKELYGYFLDTLLEIARSASETTSGDARGWLEREIDREYQQIRQAAIDDSTKPFSNEQFESGVVALKDFAAKRPGIVTAEVNATPR